MKKHSAHSRKSALSKKSKYSKKSAIEPSSDDDSSSSSLSSYTKKTSADAVVLEMPPSFPLPPSPKTKEELRSNKKSIKKLRASLHSRDSTRSSFVDLAKEKRVAKEKIEELDETKSQLHKRMQHCNEQVETMSLAASRGLPTSKPSEMDKLLQERSETFLRLREVETQRGLYKDRLKAAEAEAQKLRCERVETTKRIAELEEQNAALKRQVKEPSEDLKERSAPHNLKERSERSERIAPYDWKDRSERIAPHKAKSNSQLMRSEHDIRPSSRRQDMKKAQSERRVYTSSKTEELCTTLDHSQQIMKITAWNYEKKR
jgi:hypothetical protein